jgi:hypothetical protein
VGHNKGCPKGHDVTFNHSWVTIKDALKDTM